MIERSLMLYLYAETPVHAGSGSGLGVVDLPIQRERSTQYPLVAASSLKGKLRSEAMTRKGATEKDTPPEISAVFGPPTDSAHEHAGALSPGDARLLLFPVRSLVGVFAYATSAHLLERFRRDLCTAGEQLEWKAPASAAKDKALVAKGCDLIAGAAGHEKVVLEEYSFAPQKSETVDAIAGWLAQNAFPAGTEYEYFRAKVLTSLIVLPDDALRDFALYATEVVTRIKIDFDTHTVATGALWTEEHLPSDALLYAPLYASRPRMKEPPPDIQSAEQVLEWVRGLGLDRLQLGGSETVGRGLVAARFGEIRNGTNA